MPAMESVHDLNVDDRIESVGTVLVVMDDIHHKIHDEEFYTAPVRFDKIPSGTVSEVLFRTPDSTVSVHFDAAFSSTAAAEVSLREGATVTGSGTVVAAVNHDRSSTNAATAVIRSSPTVLASGTEIAHVQLGGGKAAGVYGSSGGTRYEFILKQNTEYILRALSEGANNDMILTPEFYEEE